MHRIVPALPSGTSSIENGGPTSAEMLSGISPSASSDFGQFVLRFFSKYVSQDSFPHILLLELMDD